MKNLKPVLLVVFAIATGICVLWCVTRVGDLNGQAAAPGLTAAQVANLHAEAGTIGDLGWCAFIFVGISVIGGLVDWLTD